MALVGKCDWVTKKWMLDSFAEAESLDWNKLEDGAWLQSQDLEYHNIDPSEGLFLLLEGTGSGAVERLTSDKEIVRATAQAPTQTRSYFRGRFLQKFGAAVRSVNWDSIEFAVGDEARTLDLRHCVEPERAANYNAAVDRADTVEELYRSLTAGA
jgi:proteasome accessory factor A